MKVGFGLKLQEEWKKYFETRPSASPPNIRVVDESKQLHEDVSEEGEGPFKQLSKEPQSSKEAIPPINVSLGYRDECITVDARPNSKSQW